MSEGKISEKCSKVKLTLKKIGERKSRKDLAEEIASTHAADASKFKATIDAMGSAEVRELANIQARARIDFNELSLPWDTHRCALNIDIDKLEKISSDCRADCEQQTEKIIDKLPDWIEQQRVALGSAFRESDYPTPDMIRDKVVVEYDILPMPDPDHDPRAGITTVQREMMRKRIVMEERKKVANSVIYLGDELTKLVEKFKDRMETYNGKKKGSFNDTIVTNIRDFVEKLPDFNLGNDPQVEDVRKRLLQDIANLNPDTLRVDENVRKQAAKKADDMLSRIGSFGSAPPTDNV